MFPIEDHKLNLVKRDLSMLKMPFLEELSGLGINKLF